MERRFLFCLGGLVVYLPLLLLTDGPGLVTQLALGATTAALLWLFARRGAIEPGQIVTAIVVATIGECLLSLGWGLYSYRNALIPLYVPFGHGILYAFAAESARRRALRRIAPAITRGVLVAGSLIAAVNLALFRDEQGLLWWLLAATLMIRSRTPLLLSISFVYAQLLEWLGTALGNWRWAAEVPFAGLHSANPPSGVGVLYILLDVVTVAICTSLVSRNAKDEEIAPVPLDGLASS